jgi:hypothetical protein
VTFLVTNWRWIGHVKNKSGMNVKEGGEMIKNLNFFDQKWDFLCGGIKWD